MREPGRGADLQMSLQAGQMSARHPISPHLVLDRVARPDVSPDIVNVNGSAPAAVTRPDPQGSTILAGLAYERDRRGGGPIGQFAAHRLASRARPRCSAQPGRRERKRAPTRSRTISSGPCLK